MSHEIRMPRLTDDMEEGTVIRWLVKQGQMVSTGDPIAEVETDKANVEIEAEQSGVLQEILVGEGSRAPVGAVLAVLGDSPGAGRSVAADTMPEADGRPSTVDPPAAPAPVADPATETKEAQGPRTAAVRQAIDRVEHLSGESSRPKGRDRSNAPSPVARELAAQHGIDLRGVAGSGPGGRIVKRDVEALLAGGGAPDAAPSGAPLPEQSAGAAREQAPAPGDGATAGAGLSRMRRTIAARMEKAKREIPHFYLRSEMDFGELLRLRDAARQAESMPGLTLTHLLLRAIAEVLPRHPQINATWQDDTVHPAADVNIGIAVALPDGLLVPVVKRAQDLTLGQIAAEARALTERARSGKLLNDDLRGATISVSNIGMHDVDELTPIINAPQAAIIGVGAVRERPVARAGALVVRPTAVLTLACDHRVVNGVEAGQFFADLKATVENPLAMILEHA